MSFQGDVPPQEVFDVLAEDSDAVLVDVRTKGELVHIGLPDLDGVGGALVTIEWQMAPDGRMNPSFLEELENADIDPTSRVYFICRSGVRSHAAAVAAAQAGFTQTFNVSGGFEGVANQAVARKETIGWKSTGLPWSKP